MGGEATARATVVLGAQADVGPEELEALGLGLRNQLLELDVEDVELADGGAAPTGAKSPELIATGALAVSLALPVLRSVVKVVVAWMEHRPVRTVTITIGDNSLEVQGVSAGNQQKLIDAFIVAQESARTGDTAAAAPDPVTGADPSPVPDTDGAA
ncbi:hypothetical protein FNH08_50210 [Streptomyces spongiae]|uniref:Uncharacterized protein n=1 Tax=Streptomyces spongiae TaxID=565072 RepID=A0A5N8Y0S4_9ACTN|nr:hypothetical protein [Streptomyces spongiae]